MARRSVIAGAAYLAVMAGLIYGVLDTGALPNTDTAAIGLLVCLGAIDFATGYFSRSFAVAWLPLAAIIVAVPAGYPDDVEGEPIPISVGLMFIAIPAMLIIALGAGLAKWRVARASE
jgi:hypothetical protein